MGETTRIDLSGVGRHSPRKADCKRPMLKELNCELKRPFLMDKPEIFIGRDEACEIVLDDIKASRRHVQIIYENHADQAASPRVLLRDLGSTNKTYVNGQLAEQAELRDNDTILIGSTAFGFFLRDESTIRAEQRLVELASNDGLTGLRNRAFFDMSIVRAFGHARGLGKPLSLALLDIDHFKLINDTHGHPMGDYVLREIGRLVAASIRSKDLGARYGGEEFAVILDEANLDVAAAQAERIRKAVEEKDFSVGSKLIRVTASAGVATLDEAMPDHTALIQAADRALYQSKQSGRNMVTRAPSSDRPVTDAEE